jgi:hypothetical protein
MTPWNHGYVAFLNDYSVDTNPYPKDGDEAIEWERGYDTADRNELMIRLTFNFWPDNTI